AKAELVGADLVARLDRQVPAVNVAGLAERDEALAVGEERDLRRVAVVGQRPLRNVRLWGPVERPALHYAADVAGQQQAGVRSERQARWRRRSAAQGRRFQPRLGIPDADDVVVAGDDALAVGGEGERARLGAADHRLFAVLVAPPEPHVLAAAVPGD